LDKKSRNMKTWGNVFTLEWQLPKFLKEQGNLDDWQTIRKQFNCRHWTTLTINLQKLTIVFFFFWKKTGTKANLLNQQQQTDIFFESPSHLKN
jgi:hypothetical protein